MKQLFISLLLCGSALAQPAQIPINNVQNYGRLPGGRISDNTSSCAHTTDSTTVQTLYYLPCISGDLPISPDGSTLTIWAIPSTATTLVTTNGTNFPTNTIFDFYAFINSGSVTYCAVAWGTSTAGSSARGGSATITTIKGITVNNGAWTCLNGATSYTLTTGEATLLGTFKTSSAQNITVQFAPSAASGGAACTIGYANVYNTQSATCLSRDSKSSWTYALTALQQLDASTGNQANWVDPLGAYPYSVQLTCSLKPNAAVTTNGAYCAIGLNSTTASSGVAAANGAVDPVSVTATLSNIAPQSGGGLNYIAALQSANTTSNSTWYGTGLTLGLQTEGLTLSTLY